MLSTLSVSTLSILTTQLFEIPGLRIPTFPANHESGSHACNFCLWCALQVFVTVGESQAWERSPGEWAVLVWWGGVGGGKSPTEPTTGLRPPARLCTWADLHQHFSDFSPFRGKDGWKGLPWSIPLPLVDGALLKPHQVRLWRDSLGTQAAGRAKSRGSGISHLSRPLLAARGHVLGEHVGGSFWSHSSARAWGSPGTQTPDH